jgi:hypothetical protein
MGSKSTDLRYLDAADKFRKYAYLALEAHFPTRNDFDRYFTAIRSPERQNLFLKTASFYLFLVKSGDWVVNVPGSNDVIDYLTNTYKYITIFSLIESLSEERFIEFHDFLIRRRSNVGFPICCKETLDKHYRNYKEEFGSIQRCIRFFLALSATRQDELVSKLEIKGTDASIENFAKYLYQLRSKYVHGAELIVNITGHKVIGRHGDKIVVCRLSISDMLAFFEEGLKVYFQEVRT